MSDLIARLAILVPISMIVWVLIGAAARAIGRDAWPWTVDLTAGALFGLTYGGIEFVLAESYWRGYIAAAVSALVATLLAPRIWAYHASQTSPSNDHRTRRTANKRRSLVG